MGVSTHFSPDGEWVACGLPSPGSRRQGYMGGEHLKPATADSVLITADTSRVTCKRCRKSPDFRRYLTPQTK